MKRARKGLFSPLHRKKQKAASAAFCHGAWPNQLFMAKPKRSITAFSDWKVLRMNWVYSSVPM